MDRFGLFNGKNAAVFTLAILGCVGLIVPIDWILPALTVVFHIAGASPYDIGNNLIPPTNIQFYRMTRIDLVIEIRQDALISHCSF